ncbi:MAG: hypothetical protein ACU0CY_13685 [Maritimibacter harenae]|jgi:hypothetical protein|uniref:Uncharacterized protein n=1 Tax=Maritimibacter harenae TaxID=2606218 RepID=A0A845M7U0_9RHOB|nr:hypothetical protein [Maritimibacter harenae]MZR12291.1 hypothetical protein [Maritimibacter harenae]
MTNVIDFAAYRATRTPRVVTRDMHHDALVSMSNRKPTTRSRSEVPHVTTDVLATTGTAC